MSIVITCKLLFVLSSSYPKSPEISNGDRKSVENFLKILFLEIQEYVQKWNSLSRLDGSSGNFSTIYTFLLFQVLFEGNHALIIDNVPVDGKRYLFRLVG